MADNYITDAAEIAERDWDGHSEPSDDKDSDLSATKGSTDERIEFHVQMRNYTMRDMDVLIVEAAANLIVGKFNERTMAKTIEEHCIAQINTKATAALDKVTSDIIEQPLTPTFGEKKPVTMREFLGLYGREYLETKVDWRDGKPAGDSGFGYGEKITRAEYLVRRYIDSKFKTEIEKATTAAISTIQRAVKDAHQEILAKETARIRDAITKVTTHHE